MMRKASELMQRGALHVCFLLKPVFSISANTHCLFLPYLEFGFNHLRNTGFFCFPLSQMLLLGDGPLRALSNRRAFWVEMDIPNGEHLRRDVNMLSVAAM